MFEAKKIFVSLLGMILLVFSASWGAEIQTAEQQKKAALFLQGAKLWPNYCGNCHNPRGPSDRSPVDWDLIMMHMRARANMPPDVTEAILEYLKKR
jgi:mono/diheme cytochrome c family protein